MTKNNAEVSRTFKLNYLPANQPVNYKQSFLERISFSEKEPFCVKKSKTLTWIKFNLS